MQINIAHIEPCSYIYGPGRRFVLWLQGCSIHCKGCWNKTMWSFAPNKLYEIDEIWQMIVSEKANIEGITLLGGEPMDQYSAILDLLKRSKEGGLSVMLFTGYELEEIKRAGQEDVLLYVDILITGRYREELRTLNHQWIGSTNQEIHFLTERYNRILIDNGNYIEITIDGNGEMTLLGFPDQKWRNI